MTSTTAPLALPVARPGLRDRFARRLLHGVFSGITHGALTVIDGDGRHRFGPGGNLEAELHVLDPGAYSRLAFGGSVGAGGAYADGRWDSPDLVALIRLLARNREALGRWTRGPARVMALPGRLHRWRRRNTRAGSRDNIAAHYDLSNEFFGLWLDETLTYSAAWFDTPAATLEEAQTAKLDRICRKLRLSPEDHLLEIGTGWGAFAVHAAREYGCRVTTTTVSREQHRLATERVRAAGLEDRVEVLLRDYRDLEGTYDKLVSVEMIEAVGPEFLDGFFRVCGERLRPDGLFLLQAITIDDREYERAARSVDFIQHYIFPGSCIPSVARMVEATRRETRLRLLDLEDLTGHYATTLARWRERFLDRSGELDRLGFDLRFRRLWTFYFAYCEGGFRERRIGDVHLLFAGPDHRGGSGLLPVGDEA